jgi:ABC-type antimicrobial peptide transport system permease subunit
VLLAGVGLFGLMSQAVTQRRKEIGIRMTGGANRRRIVWDVVRDTLTVTLSGLASGLLAALGTVQVVETLLFGVRPEDPLTLSLAAARSSSPRSSRALCRHCAHRESIH